MDQEGEEMPGFNHRYQKYLDKFFKESSKRTRIVISLSVIALLLFLSAAALLPFKDKIFNYLYPKPKSKAIESRLAEPYSNLKLRLLAEYDLNKDGRLSMAELVSPKHSTASSSLKSLQYQGYLVEFTDETLIDFKKKQEKEGRVSAQSLKDYEKNVLLPKHEEAKKDILKKIGKDTLIEPGKVKVLSEEEKQKSVKLLGEFTKTFNGIALDISDEDVKKVKESRFVKRVYPNYKVYPLLSESASLIKASDVWNSQTIKDNQGQSITGKEVTIGIIDSGIDYTHPELGGCTKEQFLNKQCAKVIDGWDFGNYDNDPMDDAGHGTHVAATAAGNGILKGIAYEAQLIGYKVSNTEGLILDSWIIAAIDRSVDPNSDNDFSDHLDVINLSLGGPGDPDSPDSRAIDRAASVGVTAVIAAGNEGPDELTVGSPGVARKAITVGASDKQDKMAGFSSRGPLLQRPDSDSEELIKPNITAPGVGICAARLPSFEPWKRNSVYAICGSDDKHVLLSGTSMATPHVAGAVALIKQAHPDWDPQQIKGAIMTTAQDLGGKATVQGSGRIDILKAIQSKTIITPASLSYGFVDRSSQTWTVKKLLTIKNIGTSLSSYSLTMKDTITGATFAFTQNTNNFTLEPQAITTIEVTLTVDNNLLGEGLYSNEILVQEGTALYRLPVYFFKKNILLSLSRNATNRYFSAEISTPYIRLVNSPRLLLKSPSAQEVTFSAFSLVDNLFGIDKTIWRSSEIEVNEEGNYSLTAQTEEMLKNEAQTILVVDKVPPSFTVTEAHDQTNMDIKVQPTENLASAFSPRFADNPEVNVDAYLHWFPNLFADSDGNNVFLAYRNHIIPDRKRDLDKTSTEFLKSSDGGQTWNSASKLADDISWYPEVEPAITKLNDKLYAAFVDSGKMYLRSSGDEGNTWDQRILLTDDYEMVDYINTFVLKQGNNKLHLIYYSNVGLKYKSSSDGLNWDSARIVAPINKIEVPNQLTINFFSGLDMDINSGMIRVVYTVMNKDGTFGVLYFLTSPDGINWSTKEVVKEERSLLLEYPSFVSSGQNIFIAWDNNLLGQTDFAKSLDGGNTWEVTKNITGGRNIDMVAHLAFDGEKIYLSWLRDIFGGMYLKSSNNFGSSWSGDIELEKGAYIGSAFSSGKTAHLTWASGGLGANSRVNYTNSKQLLVQSSFNNNKQYIEMTPAENNSWVGRVPIQEYGEYNITVAGTDLAGNTANTSAILSVYAPSCQTLLDRIKAAFLTTCANPKYDKAADLNKSGTINGADTSKLLAISSGFTNEAACQAALNDPNDPCVVSNLSSGLIASYQFEENSTSQGAVKDSSPNGNNGTALNTSYTASGKYGGAWQFNGTNSYITVPDSSSLDVTGGAVTISAWVNPSSLPAETSIVSKGGTSSCGNYDLYVYNGKLSLLSSRSCNWAFTSGTASITPNTWQHVAAVTDGVNVYYYINGVLKDSKAFGGPGAADNGALEIGKQQSGAPGNFAGVIDDLRIYNRVLSAAEIQALYNLSPTPSSTLPSGLVGLWRLDENSGTTAADGSSGNHPVTLSGNASWTGGKLNSAVILNGTTSYLNPTTINGFGSLVGNSSYTISLWAKTNTANTRQVILGDWNSSGANQSIALEFGGYNMPADHITTLWTSDTGTRQYLDSGVVYSPNAWYHLVISVDAATGARTVYVNGVLKGSDIVSGKLGNGSKLSFGRAGDYNGIYLNGVIDDVRIYNRVLSSPEIQSLYSLTVTSSGY